jgi:hypothetical protein
MAGPADVGVERRGGAAGPIIAAVEGAAFVAAFSERRKPTFEGR